MARPSIPEVTCSPSGHVVYHNVALFYSHVVAVITPSGEVSPRGRALVPGVVERKIPKMLTAPTWRKQLEIYSIYSFTMYTI